MMEQHYYVSEKLRELARDRRAGRPGRPSSGRPRRHVLAPLARAAGRRLHRAGEALESWGAPRPATGG